MICFSSARIRNAPLGGTRWREYGGGLETVCCLRDLWGVRDGDAVSGTGLGLGGDAVGGAIVM